MTDEDDGSKPMPPAFRWTFHGVVLVATFAIGFAAGSLSDGTKEVISEFGSRSDRSQPPAPGASLSPMQQQAPNPGPVVSVRPIAPKPHGHIDWQIAVAPGTPITEITVDGRQLEQPVRLRFSALARGSAPTPVATLWLEPRLQAAISLPPGAYRIGSTRLGPDIQWDERAGDENFLPRPLLVELIDPDEKAPSLSVNVDGTLKDAAAPVAAKAIRKPKSRSKGEYEGLGKRLPDSGTTTDLSIRAPDVVEP